MITVQSRIQFLYILAKQLPDESICAEIGVFQGDFSRDILDIINPRQLVLIDPFTTDASKTYGANYNNLPTAYSTDEDYLYVNKRFEGDSRVIIDKNYSYDTVRHYHEEHFSLIYLDGSHLYEDIKKDLNDWYPKLKENSIISGHDYVDHEVKQAVDEFKEEHKLELFLYNENGGDWALR